MSQNKISKIIILIITVLLIACISTSVLAVDLGLLGEDGEETETGNDDGPVTDLSGEFSQKEETEKETEKETGTTGGNTSTYPESNIPHAGIEDTIIPFAFIIFGIIGGYAFIKMSDYSNI